MLESIAATAPPVTPGEAPDLVTEFNRKLDAGEIELPFLPATAFKVFNLANSPDADAREIAELVEKDQKIASDVLRVANSAAFSGQAEIVTLRQAITRLGLKVLSEIVLGTALKASVYEDKHNLDRMQLYWREGLGAALWAKEVARMRRANVETAYLCGLLHNVGKPLSLKFLASLNVLQDDELVQIVDVAAPQIGARLAENWKLPGPARMCIEYYNNYHEAPDYREDACGVYASLMLTRHMLDEENVSADGLVGDESLQSLNIYPEDLGKLLDKKSRVAAELESFS
ncbi:MAG: HDOD domain-containing protein [Xanthomonadales bacterium]|nr:HDOD domain-containing protein [Xanthomonadales bacterium]